MKPGYHKTVIEVFEGWWTVSLHGSLRNFFVVKLGHEETSKRVKTECSKIRRFIFYDDIARVRVTYQELRSLQKLTISSLQLYQTHGMNLSMSAQTSFEDSITETLLPPSYKDSNNKRFLHQETF